MFRWSPPIYLPGRLARSWEISLDFGETPMHSFDHLIRIRPESGLLVVFPSWLYHWATPTSGKHPASPCLSMRQWCAKSL